MAFDVHPQLLRALRAVLETGSLTAASERLGFSQSALSKQIAALEHAAGARLLERRPRGVEATPAGRLLAVHAAAVLDRLDAAERDLAAIDAPVGGSVALGAFPTAAACLAPAVVARVAEGHPAVVVDVAVASTPVQLRRLRAGTLDLALVASGDDLPDWDATGIVLERLAAGRLRLAVHEAHPLAAIGRGRADDLRDERWIVGSGAKGEPQFGAWPTIAEPVVVAELADWTARLGFVAAGLGVTTIPSLMLRALPRGVVAIDVDDDHLRARSLQLAHVGALDGAAAIVRAAVVDEAARLAAA